MPGILPDQAVVVVINNDGMGHAEEPLQHKLITSYLTFLQETEPLPKAICFYADGVKLAVTGSPVLEQLKKLQDKGVILILCSTCLNYLNLRDEVQLGIVGVCTTSSRRSGERIKSSPCEAGIRSCVTPGDYTRHWSRCTIMIRFP